MYNLVQIICTYASNIQNTAENNTHELSKMLTQKKIENNQCDCTLAGGLAVPVTAAYHNLIWLN